MNRGMKTVDRIIITFFAAMLVLAISMVSGCWSTPNDYWADVDTETETETTMVDGGECLEDDTDNCMDGGT